MKQYDPAQSPTKPSEHTGCVCQNTAGVHPACGTAHKLQQKAKGKTIPQPAGFPESEQFM